MLVEAAHYFRDEQDGEPSKLTLTGQELNSENPLPASRSPALRKAS
jgi:hypothetical protein